MNTKFESLKQRYENLKKAKETKPEVMGNQPLTTTTREVAPSSFPESGKELVAEGAPRKWNQTPSAEIQTSATNFSPKAQESRGKSQEKATEAEAQQREKFGPFAGDMSQKKEGGATHRTAWTQPRAIEFVIPSFVNDLEQKQDPKRNIDPHDFKKYALYQMGHLHNLFQAANPLESREAQLKNRQEHWDNLKAQDIEKGQEAVKQMGETFTTFKDNAAVARHGGKDIVPTPPRKLPSESITEEEIKAKRPDIAAAVEAAQTPEYKMLAEEEPALSRYGKGSKTGKLTPGGLENTGYNNLDNTAAQMLNSGMRYPAERAPTERMGGSLAHPSSKTQTTSLFFPGHGKELYFQEHATPTLDDDAYEADIKSTQPQVVEAAHAEKSNLENALGQVHESLSNAIRAQAKNNIDEHMAHLNTAKAAAQKVTKLAHNQTKEAQNSHSFLENLGNNLNYATNYPQRATKEGETTYRDALSYLRNLAGTHATHLSSIGPAFKENHVARKEILNPGSLEEMERAAQESIQEGAPKPGVQSTAAEWETQHPYKYTKESERQAKLAHHVAMAHQIHSPEIFHDIGSEKLAPKAQDDSFTSELKNFMAANMLRRYTHPNEFKNRPNVNPLSEEFLGSVPVTQIHNHFDLADQTQLAGKPARQFVEQMSQRIMNHGVRHLTDDERKEFNVLNEKYDLGQNMTDQEKARHSTLMNEIHHNGLASMAVQKHISPREKEAWDQARFIAATRQQRQDYVGDTSSHHLVNQANDIAQSNDPDAMRKLTEIKKQLGAKPWQNMRWSNDQQRYFINPTKINSSSWVKSKARQHVDNLIKQAISKHKTNMGKSMGHQATLQKCRNLLSKSKEKLAKAVVPQGKYIRTADGTLVLVDLHSQPAQAQQKQVAQVQQKQVQQPKPVTPPPPSKPATPAPAIPKPPVQSKPEIPQTPKQAAPVTKPPEPKQPLPQPPKMSLGQKPAESIGDVARKIKAENAMSVFGYSPKK